MDRNNVIRPAIDVFLVSLSARRAWIEIGKSTTLTRIAWVALRKESVDRNLAILAYLILSMVALRKESVDRNSFGLFGVDTVSVALRKESVDRNFPWLDAEY